MNFRDQWATDENGKKFVFTVAMQRRLSEAGLPIDPSALAQLPEPVSAPKAHAPKERRVPAPSSEQTSEEQAPSRAKIEEPTSIQIDPFTGKYIGRVKWYNMRKKYGFIMRGGGEEIFFHQSSSEQEFGALQEGQWVLYDVEETHKGPEATDLEIYSQEE